MFRRILKASSKQVPLYNNLAHNFATYKSSTGLVGLAVDPDGINTLKKLSTEILTSVQVYILSIENYLFS